MKSMPKWPHNSKRLSKSNNNQPEHGDSPGSGSFSVVSRSRFYAAWTALDIACDLIDDNDPAFYVSLHKQNKRLCIFDINVFIDS